MEERTPEPREQRATAVPTLVDRLRINEGTSSGRLVSSTGFVLGRTLALEKSEITLCLELREVRDTTNL